MILKQNILKQMGENHFKGQGDIIKKTMNIVYVFKKS